MADSVAAICNLALLKIGAPGSLITTSEDDSPEAVALKLLYAQKRDELLISFRWPWAERRAYPTQLGGSTYAAGTTYGLGDYVSYTPSAANIVNTPESISTFVYLSLAANNTGNAPDSSPTKWHQISRAAWAYAFVLPPDVIEIRGLYHGNRNEREDEAIPYELGNEQVTLDDGSTIGPGTLLYTDAGLPWEVITGSNTGGSTPKSIELIYTAQITDPKQFPPDFTQALAWNLAEELCLSIRKDPGEAAKASVAAAVAWGKAVQAARLGIRKDPEPMPSFIAARGPRGWSRR